MGFLNNGTPVAALGRGRDVIQQTRRGQRGVSTMFKWKVLHREHSSPRTSRLYMGHRPHDHNSTHVRLAKIRSWSGHRKDDRADVLNLRSAFNQRLDQPVTCPLCDNNNVRLSTRPGALEQLLTLVYVRPFRCRDCYHRFLKLSRWTPNPRK